MFSYICTYDFRRGAQLASNILSFVGAVLMGFSKMANSIEMIIIARFLIGVFSGKRKLPMTLLLKCGTDVDIYIEVVE